jgi:hypothetical protein
MGDFGEPTFSAVFFLVKPNKLREVMNRELANTVKRTDDQDCGSFQYRGASVDLSSDYIFLFLVLYE